MIHNNKSIMNDHTIIKKNNIPFYFVNYTNKKAYF